ncbi:MAG: hypothetical protein R3C01_05895 [Planctomycetaceae bacterium]
MKRFLMLAIAAGGLALFGATAQAQCYGGGYGGYSHYGGYYAPSYSYGYAPVYSVPRYQSYGYGGGYYSSYRGYNNNYGYWNRGYGNRGYGRGVSIRFGF